jgi:hypothetical protein
MEINLQEDFKGLIIFRKCCVEISHNLTSMEWKSILIWNNEIRVNAKTKTLLKMTNQALDFIDFRPAR